MNEGHFKEIYKAGYLAENPCASVFTAPKLRILVSMHYRFFEMKLYSLWPDELFVCVVEVFPEQNSSIETYVTLIKGARCKRKLLLSAIVIITNQKRI